ncbi:T9SS type A sorting domain-containing protein [Arachidicoccus ginsenosidivorans]|uniref:T9SS type A sorting domain-containing protein n=1 Tax=Arachidicoccus ginsenosidivorans TaxID=496057 RepID=A0A5B8VPY9_9BACT|nr:T9SS type A sorting domain-containing protein [Arachidicoccus ginsenosidivorans]QEC72746.1 T9SS type A sorting domain-containing protein [Arachidicoccus ginsenosidivorans]
MAYSALDNIASLAGQPSTVFYRIVGVDKAGYSYYSIIATVHPVWNNWSFSVAPNPITQDKLQILLSSKEITPIKVTLMDLTGRVILQQNITPGSAGKITVNTPHLAAGMYLVQVLQGIIKPTLK